MQIFEKIESREITVIQKIPDKSSSNICTRERLFNLF